MRRLHEALSLGVVVGIAAPKNVAQALRAVYRAADAKIGLAALDAFAQSPWGEKYPAIAQSCRRNWDRVIPFFAFPEGVRKIIYTTNAIEALNSKLPSNLKINRRRRLPNARPIGWQFLRTYFRNGWVPRHRTRAMTLGLILVLAHHAASSPQW
jgi:transposase-like protein